MGTAANRSMTNQNLKYFLAIIFLFKMMIPLLRKAVLKLTKMSSIRKNSMKIFKPIGGWN